jgi:tetratricopeptide (TPR) repeat protein
LTRRPVRVQIALFAMDQLSATLDRGWDLAQRGDAIGAQACAKRALELDPKSPEVHNLLGYSAAMAGEPEEALEHYKQAIALDESYFEAMLNGAEVLMHPLGEWDDAVAMCNDAYALAETDEEIADCLLLKVDALMSKGATDEAMRVMRLIPEGPFDNASYTFLIGRAYYELGDMERASPLIEEAARKDPSHADAQYYLGLVRDERGDSRGATEAFLRARAIDVTREAPAWAPSPEAFGTIVEACIRKLDALLGRYVHEAEVFVVDVPGAELVVDGVDPRALMIIDSQISQEDGKPAGLPRCRIFVYQRNVERASGTVEQLEDEVVAALEREITAVFLEPDAAAKKETRHLN